MEIIIKRVVDAAEELLKSVQFDDHGAVIGNKWVGGNGGMISAGTIRKADELRRAIDHLKRVEAL